MAKTLQFKRYQTSTLAATTGSVGELIVDTNTSILTVHDGLTIGGTRLATQSSVANSNNAIASLNTYTISAFSKANSVTALAQAAFDAANTVSSGLSANVTIISGINSTQNTNITAVDAYATSSYAKANSANVLAQAAFAKANSASITADAAYVFGAAANSASIQANAAILLAQGAFDQANTAAAGSIDSYARTTANAANVLSQSSFDKANTLLGNFKISDSSLGTTDGADGWGGHDMYFGPNGESSAWINIPRDSTSVNGAQLVIGNYPETSGGISISSYLNNWIFNTDGSTSFPALGVPRGDTTGGSISGYTLLMGKGDNEAIISTPNGNETYTSSQRLVINPGKGADGTSGEGGDIYLWAGRGGSVGGSGGDVKIRGGQGMGSGGAGGYIRIEAGDGYSNTGAPGYIELLGGTGGSDQDGGYVTVKGGYGQIDGGYTQIRGGSGNAGLGGEVNIIGGDSNQGLGSYGNVTVATGASTWSFTNDGVMHLPGEGVLQSTNDQLTLRSLDTTTGNANLVYLGTSGGLGFQDTSVITGNWLEIFRSGINPQISTPNNLLIQTSSTSNAAVWTFSDTGTLTLPGDLLATGDLSITVPNGIPTGLANWDGQGGWDQPAYTNVSTTGGTGTGLTVDVAAGGSGYIDINQITINNPGSGYTDGDVITIDNENNLPGTFTITVSASAWKFSGNNRLYFPDNTYQNTAFTGSVTGDLTVSGNTTVSGIAPGYAPNRPSFRVYGGNTTNNLTTTQNGTGNLTANNWVVDYNQGNYLNNTTGIFTAPVAGLYLITSNVRTPNNANPTINQAVVVKNEATTLDVLIMIEFGANTSMNHTGGSTIAKLDVGDTLSLRVLSGQINFDANDNWSTAYIG